MNRKGSLIALVVVALVAAGAGIFVGRLRSPSTATADVHAAELFYRQTLRDANGEMRSMSERRGKPVVVNFWATWCVPCVKEIPAFSKASVDAAGRVAFVGLGIDSPDNIAAFAARFKPSYPLLAAGSEGTELARAFGNETGALPFTVVLGPDGRVVASHLGQVDEATLVRWVGSFAAAQ